MRAVPEACVPFAEDLSALIDEELAATRALEVRAHVDACEHCAARLRELCDADLALAAMATPALPDDLHERLARRLAVDAPNVTRPRRRAQSPARRRTFVRSAGALAAAAAVALVVLIGLPRDADDPGVPLAHEPVPDAGRDDVEPTPQPEAPVIAEVPESEPPPASPTPEALATPEPVIADAVPQPGAPEPALTELAGASDEDVALALELGVVEDLELLANLDLLEALVDLGVAEGA